MSAAGQQPPPPSYEPSGDGKKAPPPESSSGRAPQFGARRQQLYLSWVPVDKGGRIPERAIEGRDSNGTFVARANHGYHLLPGKAARGHNCCYVSHSGAELSVPEYQVLCDSSMDAFGHAATDWVASDGSGPPPAGAVAGGCSDHGEPLYIARGAVAGSRVYGYFAESLKAASFPYGGQEHRSVDFELLVLR